VKYAYPRFSEIFGSITEALETILQQRGGACRPVASSLSNPTSKMSREGLDLNFYLHPYLDKFTPPIFVFLAIFFPKSHETLRIPP